MLLLPCLLLLHAHALDNAACLTCDLINEAPDLIILLPGCSMSLIFLCPYGMHCCLHSAAALTLQAADALAMMFTLA